MAKARQATAVPMGWLARHPVARGLVLGWVVCFGACVMREQRVDARSTPAGAPIPAVVSSPVGSPGASAGTEGVGAQGEATRPQPLGDSEGVPVVTIVTEGPSHVARHTSVLLRVRIESRLVPARAFWLALRVPGGVRLLKGEPRTLIPSAIRATELSFVLAIDEVPRDDLVADVTLADAPEHRWSAVYRFGRAAAPPPPPQPAGGFE